VLDATCGALTNATPPVGCVVFPATVTLGETNEMVEGREFDVVTPFPPLTLPTIGPLPPPLAPVASEPATGPLPPPPVEPPTTPEMLPPLEPPPIVPATLLPPVFPEMLLPDDEPEESVPATCDASTKEVIAVELANITIAQIIEFLMLFVMEIFCYPIFYGNVCTP